MTFSDMTTSKIGDEGQPQYASSTRVTNHSTSQMIQSSQENISATVAELRNLSTATRVQTISSGQVFPQETQIVARPPGDITGNVTPMQQIQINNQANFYLPPALPQTYQIAPEQSFMQIQGVQVPTSNGQAVLHSGDAHSVAQTDEQYVTIRPDDALQTLQLPISIQQTIPMQVPVLNAEGHTVLQTVHLQVIPSIQGMPGANLFQSQGQPITVSIPPHMVPQSTSQNAEGKVPSTTTVDSINGTQQQREIAVASVQFPNGQVGHGQVNQIIAGTDRTAAWYPPSSINVQDSIGFGPGNVIQVQGLPVIDLQGSQIQSITANHYQQMPLLSPIQSVYGPQVINQYLQQDLNDQSKGQVVATGMNPVATKASTVGSSIKTRRQKLHESCTCPNCKNNHGRSDKSTKKLHACHIPGCTKTFTKTSHLRSHILKHSGVRPHVCTWANCVKSFTRSDELQRHRKTHTGEKKFQCTVCSKKFLRTDHLSKHQKTHQREKKAEKK